MTTDIKAESMAVWRETVHVPLDSPMMPHLPELLPLQNVLSGRVAAVQMPLTEELKKHWSRCGAMLTSSPYRSFCSLPDSGEKWVSVSSGSLPNGKGTLVVANTNLLMVCQDQSGFLAWTLSQPPATRTNLHLLESVYGEEGLPPTRPLSALWHKPDKVQHFRSTRT